MATWKRDKETGIYSEDTGRFTISKGGKYWGLYDSQKEAYGYGLVWSGDTLKESKHFYDTTIKYYLLLDNVQEGYLVEFHYEGKYNLSELTRLKGHILYVSNDYGTGVFSSRGDWGTISVEDGVIHVDLNKKGYGWLQEDFSKGFE